MKSYIILLVTIAIGFSSCIREEEPEPSPQGQIVTQRVDKNNNNQLVMEGALVAFGPIPVEKYGFVWTVSTVSVADPINVDLSAGTGGSFEVVDYGATDKGVKFSHTIASPSNGSTYRVRAFTKIEEDDTPKFGNLIIFTP